MGGRIPASAYRGTDPYIFVSYSHRDSEIVYQAIETLSAQYFRVWYDEGIEPGSIWKSTLDQQIAKSRCVLAFLSQTAADSPHVFEELSAARIYERQIFPVYLERVALPESLRDYVMSYQAIALTTARDSGRWTPLINALPRDTRQFQTHGEQLDALEAGLRDPLLQAMLRQSRTKELGWCSIHRRGAPENDFVQTCKMCGGTDWFEPGLSPAAECASCGLSRDPGKALPWFNAREITRDGENVWVRCTRCGTATCYAFVDGPPLTCPRCGRLESG